MHHLCCGVRLSLTGDLSITTLSLSALGGEKIAGVFSPSFSDGTLTEISGDSTIIFDYDTPVVLSDVPQSFYFFFAPDTFSKGLALQAGNEHGANNREWRFASGLTLEKGKMYLLPETAFSSREWEDGRIVELEGLSEDLINFEL